MALESQQIFPKHSANSFKVSILYFFLCAVRDIFQLLLVTGTFGDTSIMQRKSYLSFASALSQSISLEFCRTRWHFSPVVLGFLPRLPFDRHRWRSVPPWSRCRIRSRVLMGDLYFSDSIRRDHSPLKSATCQETAEMPTASVADRKFPNCAANRCIAMAKRREHSFV